MLLLLLVLLVLLLLLLQLLLLLTRGLCSRCWNTLLSEDLRLGAGRGILWEQITQLGEIYSPDVLRLLSLLVRRAARCLHGLRVVIKV